jgi:alanine-glyoxylate transaminase / serine-glyoxylate transaminase / serine-pyruvate transaminase
MILRNYPKLKPPKRILLGPGPSMTDPRVLRAMGYPTIGHLDPFLLNIYKEEQELLRTIFKTQNEWTFSLSGTGTSGMEAAMANLIESGDAVLVASHGYFGERLAEIGIRLGGVVDQIRRPWGEVFSIEEIDLALRSKQYKVFAIVHAETSTGAQQYYIRELVEIAHRTGTLVILDTVTSLGGIDVKIDEWGVDLAYSASQKCLGAPAGLAPITVSPRARETIEKRKCKVSSFYLDLQLYAGYWNGNHAYHHTASASLHLAMREALRLAVEEGLEQRFNRHRENAKTLWEGLNALGLPALIPLDYRLPVLTTPVLSLNMDESSIRKRLLDEFNVEIAGGFGQLKGKVWRIGLMGFSSRLENVVLLLDALKTLL